jgi:hypothetical protein
LPRKKFKNFFFKIITICNRLKRWGGGSEGWEIRQFGVENFFSFLWVCFFLIGRGGGGTISIYRSYNLNYLWEIRIEIKIRRLIFQKGYYIDLMLVFVLGGIPWQVYFQRVLSSKTEKSARYMSFLAAIGCILAGIPPIMIGAIAKTTG